MFGDSVVTNVGKTLLARWIQGTVLEIDTAAAGTGTVSVVQLMAQTELVEQKASVSIVNYELIEGGLRLQLQLTSVGLTESFTLNQIGVWGKVDSETALLAIFQDSTGVRVPTESEMADYVFTFYATIQLNNDGDFSVTIDTAALVTHSDLKKAVREIEDYLAQYLRAYRAVIGDGRKSYTITHNLGTEAIVCQLWAKGDNLPIYTATKIDENILQIDFEEAIDTDSVEVVIQATHYTKIEAAEVDWENVTNVATMPSEEMESILNEEDGEGV